MKWLTDNTYSVGDGAPALIRPYLLDGLHLLALRLTKGSEVGSIRPLMLTYEAEKPMIPIKLTAVAANSDMGVMTWLLSNARGVPQNYLAIELNEARINSGTASGTRRGRRSRCHATIQHHVGGRDDGRSAVHLQPGPRRCQQRAQRHARDRMRAVVGSVPGTLADRATARWRRARQRQPDRHWPTFDNQPSNTRILQISASGTGMVLEDNAREIRMSLSSYNSAYSSHSSSGGCHLSGTSTGGGWAFAVALGALVALRRRRR